MRYKRVPIDGLFDWTFWFCIGLIGGSYMTIQYSFWVASDLCIIYFILKIIALIVFGCFVYFVTLVYIIIIFFIIGIASIYFYIFGTLAVQLLVLTHILLSVSFYYN